MSHKKIVLNHSPTKPHPPTHRSAANGSSWELQNVSFDIVQDAWPYQCGCSMDFDLLARERGNDIAKIEAGE